MTERIVSGLPGARRTWLIVWSAVPLFGNVLLQVMHPEARLLTAALWTSVVYCYIVALSLWATARFARQIAELEPLVNEVSLRFGKDPFQGIDGARRARGLYAEAYAPVGQQPSVETLAARASMLERLRGAGETR